MKKIPALPPLFLALCVLVSFTGCSFDLPAEDPGSSKPTTQTATAASTNNPAGPAPMDLVGTWNFSHSEIEGDTNTNGNSTVVISGESPEALTITYQDPSFPEENFSGKTLKLDAREMYPGCGNDAWVMDVDHVGAIGNTTYDLTLLEGDTLVLRFSFTVEEMTMVSYQFFIRSE